MVKVVFLLNLCGTQISKWLSQPSWDKWFSMLDLDICICQLSPACIMLIVLNLCLYLITLNFSRSTQPWSIIKQEISNIKFQKRLWHIRSVTEPSPYTAQTFFFFCFAFRLCFYLSWVSKAAYAENVAFSSIFNIKMAMQIDGETMETVTDFTFLGSKITADGDCSHEIKTCGRKAMTNLDSILKSRDITLPTNVCLVKAMVFPVVMYGC